MDKEIRVSTKSSRGRGWRNHKRPDQQFYVPGALHHKNQEQNTVNNDKNIKFIEQSARSLVTSINDIERSANKQKVVSGDKNLTEQSSRSLETSNNDIQSTTQEQNTVSSDEDLIERSARSVETSINNVQSLTPDQNTVNSDKNVTEQSARSVETSINNVQSLKPDQNTVSSDKNLTEQSARSVKTSINDIHSQTQKQNAINSDNSLTEQSGRSVETPINDIQSTAQEKSTETIMIENISDKSEDLKKTLVGLEEELLSKQLRPLSDHLDINVKVSSGSTQCGHNEGIAEDEEILTCQSLAVLLESEVELKNLNQNHHKGNDMDTNADLLKTDANSSCQSLVVPLELEVESRTADENREIVNGQDTNKDFVKKNINISDQLISCDHLNTQQSILSKSASSHHGNSNRQCNSVDNSLSPLKTKQLLNSSCEETPTPANDSNEDVRECNTKRDKLKLDKIKKKKKIKKSEHVESKESKKKKKNKKELVEGSKDEDYKSKDDKLKSKITVRKKEERRCKDDSLKKDQVVLEDEHDDDDDDSWLTKFNDDGECLDQELIKKLPIVTGIKKPVKHKTQFDFYSLAEKDTELDDDLYGHIVEIYDFCPDLKTQDLTKSLSMFRTQGYELKWVDDTHALAAFSSPLAANQAVQMCSSPLLKLRPVSQGIAESKKIAKRCFEFLQPYKPRPQTTNLTAHMLVTGALGVKSRMTEEEKQKEKDKLKEAREQKRQEKQRKADIWGD